MSFRLCALTIQSGAALRRGCIQVVRGRVKPDVVPNKIAILSGSGLSAESGLPTFRDSNGLWNEYSWMEVASPEGWAMRPEAVLAFYNERRLKAWNASPNSAHLAIAALEEKYEVVVITQNVDELHERGGSTHVIHLHGQLAYARGTSSSPKRYRIEGRPISLGQLCEDGTQLRPDIVWFGEETQNMEEARWHVATASKVLVVGTSLTVYPAASLVKAARGRAEKVLVSLDMDKVPYGFRFVRKNASEVVPLLVQEWLGSASASANH
jgi:NAD-dependent deacetylase